jgi:hypothetical protein
MNALRKLRWRLIRWRYRRWCRKQGIPDPETLAVLIAQGKADPELLRRQFGSRGDRVMAAGSQPESGRDWPAPLGEAAYHGVIGKYVKAVEKHSEADPAAILIQTLVAFGNAVGSGPHFTVEDTRHGTNLFVVPVGDTSKARKGTAYGRSYALLAAADPRWAELNDGEAGLSTPEGLIYAVRDSRGSGKNHDPGITDKRLLAAMGEFSEVLAKMKREGNPLGATIRNAWDGKSLQIRTRSQPLKATRPHVSIIAHITRTELADVLDKAQIFNGFGNRFLWVLTKRQRELPHGGSLRVADLPKIVDEVKRSIIWAEQEREIKFDRAAHKAWSEIYGELGRSEDEDRWSAITARAEPQVRRLALVYAVADRSTRITMVHLEAALEVWRYCEESAGYLFSETTVVGSLEAKLVKYLRRKRGWWTRTELSHALKGLVKSYRLDAALEALERQSIVESRQVPTKGRPRLEYRLLRADK